MFHLATFDDTGWYSQNSRCADIYLSIYVSFLSFYLFMSVFRGCHSFTDHWNSATPEPRVQKVKIRLALSNHSWVTFGWLNPHETFPTDFQGIIPPWFQSGTGTHCTPLIMIENACNFSSFLYQMKVTMHIQDTPEDGSSLIPLYLSLALLQPLQYEYLVREDSLPHGGFLSHGVTPNYHPFYFRIDHCKIF